MWTRKLHPTTAAIAPLRPPLPPPAAWETSAAPAALQPCACRCVAAMQRQPSS